jgi:sialidase-1
MKTKTIALFTSGLDGYHTYRIPALIRCANGDLLAMAEGRRDSEADHGKIDLVMRRGSANGENWGSLEVIYGEKGDITCGNPVPLLDKRGRLHLILCRNNRDAVLSMHSDDHGRTWSQLRTIFTAEALSSGFGIGVTRFGTGPCHGITLRQGRLITPIWMKFGNSLRYDEGGFRAGLLLSDDDGASWQTGALADNGTNESTVALLPDDTLIMNSRSMAEPAGFRRVSRSNDHGLTFGETIMDETLVCPNCQASIAHDSEGKLWFSNPALRNDTISYSESLRKTLTLRCSYDGGQTWPDAKLIWEGPSGYSDLCTMNDGRCAVLFEKGDQTYHESIAFAVAGPLR